jgi:hypothetical protein
VQEWVEVSLRRHRQVEDEQLEAVQPCCERKNAGTSRIRSCTESVKESTKDSHAKSTLLVQFQFGSTPSSTCLSS